MWLDSLSSAEEAVWSGFIAFGCCSFCGARILFKGIRGDILDGAGLELAARPWFYIAGILLQIPLLIFAIFQWRHGFFN